MLREFLHGGAGFCERGYDGLGAALGDVGIDHGRADIGMAEEFLNGSYIVPGFEQVRREGVAQAVGMNHFGNFGFLCGFLDRVLQDAFVDVVPRKGALPPRGFAPTRLFCFC